MRLQTSVFALASVLSFFITCRADDWPEFRGPTGAGIAENVKLPLSWSGTKNVAWKQPIPGKGWSSPVVKDQKIYLTTAVPSEDGGQSLRALCLEVSTGKINWEKEVIQAAAEISKAIHGKNSHASATPIVNGQRLFVHFGHQGTACLDLDGNIIWRNTDLKYNPVHGNGGSPILVDNLLIFSCDGGDNRFVAALDSKTGKVAWQTERGGESQKKFSFSTPLLITINGRKQLISPGSDFACAYNPADGKEIWRVRYDGYSVIPRPVFGHGLVFICTGYNTPSLVAVRPDAQGDVTDSHIQWQAKKAVPHTSSLLLHESELYMVSDGGIASCLDAKSGKVHWQERLGGNYSSSPILAGDRIYFLSEDGVASVVQVGKQFKVLAKNPIGERTLASYAVADGALFLRTEKHLYRIQEK